MESQAIPPPDLISCTLRPSSLMLQQTRVYQTMRVRRYFHQVVATVHTEAFLTLVLHSTVLSQCSSAWQ